jgi:hypothetical protein
MQADMWIMVYLGGFGYHLTEIVEMFGMDNLTIFFQVSVIQVL